MEAEKEPKLGNQETQALKWLLHLAWVLIRRQQYNQWIFQARDNIQPTKCFSISLVMPLALTSASMASTRCTSLNVGASSDSKSNLRRKKSLRQATSRSKKNSAWGCCTDTIWNTKAASSKVSLDEKQEDLVGQLFQSGRHLFHYLNFNQWHKVT